MKANRFFLLLLLLLFFSCQKQFAFREKIKVRSKENILVEKMHSKFTQGIKSSISPSVRRASNPEPGLGFVEININKKNGVELNSSPRKVGKEFHKTNFEDRKSKSEKRLTSSSPPNPYGWQGLFINLFPLLLAIAAFGIDDVAVYFPFLIVGSLLSLLGFLLGVKGLKRNLSKKSEKGRWSSILAILVSLLFFIGQIGLLLVISSPQ